MSSPFRSTWPLFQLTNDNQRQIFAWNDNIPSSTNNYNNEIIVGRSPMGDKNSVIIAPETPPINSQKKQHISSQLLSNTKLLAKVEEEVPGTPPLPENICNGDYKSETEKNDVEKSNDVFPANEVSVTLPLQNILRHTESHQGDDHLYNMTAILDDILLSLQDPVPTLSVHKPTNGSINDSVKHVSNNTGNGSMNLYHLSSLANNDSTDSRTEN